jgi:Tfp pilus assembly protein FimV
MPSFNLYRGALLTMLVGTAVAVFFIVRPPGESGGAPVVVGGDITATATPRGGSTSVATAASTSTPGTPAASPTSGTPTPEAAPTEAPWIEYTIEEGDTLFDIASEFLPVGEDLTAYAQAIANFNGLDYENPVLTPGEVLLLPKPAP